MRVFTNNGKNGNRRFWNYILAAVTLLILNSAAAYGSYGTPLRVAYPSFKPFHYMDEGGELKGFFYDIVTEALQVRMGVELVWTDYPWARCQENVKNGSDDAIITVPTPERSEYTATHPNPFYEKALNVFTYRDHHDLSQILEIKKIGDIKKYNFSVITYSGNGWHRKYIEPLGVKTHESSYLGNIWRMLAFKRGDLVIEWPPAAMPDIKKLNLSEKIINTNIVLSSMPFHLLIRKKSDFVTILPAFEKTIEAMKQDGTIQAILDKYSLGKE